MPTFTHKAVAESGSNLSSYATASYTPAANRILIATVENEIGSGTPTIPTLSGNGLTWTQVDTYVPDSTGTQVRITMFIVKTGGSPSTGAVTADFGGVAQAGCNIIIDEVDGADLSGTALQAIVAGQIKRGSVNAASNTSESITLDSAITSGNSSYAVIMHQADEATTAGSSHTKLIDASHSGPSGAIASMYKVAGGQTASGSWTTSVGGFGSLMIEIKAAATTITGTLSKTQAANTLSSSSDLFIKAITSKTQAGNTLLSASKIAIAAALNKSQAGNTLSSSSQISIEAALSKVQDGNTLSSASKLSISASLTKSQDNQSSLSSSSVSIRGIVNQAQDSNTSISQAALAIKATVAITQQGNTIDSDGRLSINASVNTTQSNNTLSSQGGNRNVGNLTATQDNNASVATARLSIAALLNSVQSNNTLLSQSFITLKATVNKQQDNNVLSSLSDLFITASLNCIQANNSLNSVIRYVPEIAGPGNIDVVHSEELVIYKAQKNSVIYANDINDL
jgi:hypothetical protein